MAITNEANYVQARDYPWQRIRFSKTTLTTTAARTYSSWTQAGSPAAGSAPSSAVAPTSATAGAIGPQFDSAGTQRIYRVIMEAGMNPGGGMITICDRLSHQGGLSGTATGAQTTNLPTAALTRYTSGRGVSIGLEIYTAIGTSNTGNTNVSYTNTTPTSGQTSATIFNLGSGSYLNGYGFGATGTSTAARFCPIPLASGDVGVTAVASVSNTVSSGTVGNFGVTLYYPIVTLPIDHMLPLSDDMEGLYGFGPWFPIVASGACLFLLYNTNGTVTGSVAGVINLGED